jgi:hypothetical protein
MGYFVKRVFLVYKETKEKVAMKRTAYVVAIVLAVAAIGQCVKVAISHDDLSTLVHAGEEGSPGV